MFDTHMFCSVCVFQYHFATSNGRSKTHPVTSSTFHWKVKDTYYLPLEGQRHIAVSNETASTDRGVLVVLVL